MRRTIQHIFCTLGMALMLTGCSDFLEEYSQDTDYVRSWKDLDELLIGDGYWPVNSTEDFNRQSNPGMFIHLLADEVEEQNSSYSGSVSGKFDDHPRLFGYLTWQQRVGQNESYSGFFPENTLWTLAYKKINIANNILHSLEKVSLSTDEDREGGYRVEGEARFLRAYYYWLLVNLYGQPYNPNTATQQPGVPLKTAPEVEDIKWQRNTVGEVYSLIESDLLAADEAFNHVTTEKKSIYRADQTAIRLLLSRVYLYMQQWQKAADYAQLVIDKHPQLQNLNTTFTPMMLKSNVENIFSMGGDDLPVILDYTWQGLRVSRGQYNAYTAFDLRQSQWLWKNGPFYGLTLREDGGQYLSITLPARTKDNYYYYAYTYSLESRESPISSLFWLRSAEAYLNRAEALAYLGQEEAARTTINTLRQARFATGSNYALTSTGSQLISDLRNERRCELVLQGQRWFDLRRYRVCTVQPEKISITHNYTYYADRGTTTPLETHQFILTEDDPSWTQPIPQEVLDFNTGMESNGNPWRTFTIVPTEN